MVLWHKKVLARIWDRSTLPATIRPIFGRFLHFKIHKFAKIGYFYVILRTFAYFFQNQIVVYFISHIHLDHVGGLVIASTYEAAEAHKPIFSSEEIIEQMKTWVTDCKKYFCLSGAYMPSRNFSQKVRVNHQSPITSAIWS